MVRGAAGFLDFAPNHNRCNEAAADLLVTAEAFAVASVPADSAVATVPADFVVAAVPADFVTAAVPAAETAGGSLGDTGSTCTIGGVICFAAGRSECGAKPGGEAVESD